MFFNENAMTVLRSRYLARDDDGNTIETPEARFRAVAEAVGGNKAAECYELMTTGTFLFNTPTLANAGRPRGQLAACFVVPIDDALVNDAGTGIFDIVRTTAIIHQTGGGTGYSFGRLRPSGARVRSSNGVASGPVSFMEVFNAATGAIKQGGIRRGAMMAELPVWHPDIREFIHAKTSEGALSNFNISVSITDEFMRAVKDDGMFHLRDPRDGAVVDTIRARGLWWEIVDCAWKLGDPGMFFIDKANAKNPLAKYGHVFEATNPCGEVPLLPWEPCNLGSINVAKFVVNNAWFDFKAFMQVVYLATEFLDNVVTANEIPVPQIREANLATRRLGLGVMGWADALNELRIPYDSQVAVDLAEDIGWHLQTAAMRQSVEMGYTRGVPPLIDKYKLGLLRNIAVTSIAPTGSISTIAGCSAGIEPYFDRQVVRQVAIGSLSESYANANEPWFRTAMEIAPEWHVRHQAAWQKHVDNAVSKTVNLPKWASLQDIHDIYMQAYDTGCKGVTIYRDGSRELQVYNSVRDCGVECEVPTAA